MPKDHKGFLRVGLAILLASFVAGFLIINNFDLSSVVAVKTNPNDIGNPKERIKAGGGNGGSGAGSDTQAGSYNRTGTAQSVDYGAQGSGGKNCGDIGDPKARQACWANAPTSGNYNGVCDSAHAGQMNSRGETCVLGGVGCNGTSSYNCQVPHWTICADRGGNGTPYCNRNIGGRGGEGNYQNPTPTPAVTPTISPTATPTATPTTAPTITPAITPTATPTSTPTSTATPTATPTETSVPTGTPNYCGGTCGSNYNCQGGLFCYQGYCRNPQCPSESSCGCPTTQTPPPVLGITAPPRLPETGGGLEVLLSFLGIGSAGIYAFKKFKVI